MPNNPDLAALSEALDRALADPWNRGLGDAHLALEKAVFSEYRAGRLVQIDEGMREATARAEAAEARVAELTAQLATARESERAAVVAKKAVLDKIDDVVRSFSDGDGYFLASQIRAHLAAMGEPA